MVSSISHLFLCWRGKVYSQTGWGHGRIDPPTGSANGYTKQQAYRGINDLGVGQLHNGIQYRTGAVGLVRRSKQLNHIVFKFVRCSHCTTIESTVQSSHFIQKNLRVLVVIFVFSNVLARIRVDKGLLHAQIQFQRSWSCCNLFRRSPFWNS